MALIRVTKNPFNIRYSKCNPWKGQIGSYRGFCKFEDVQFGLRAGLIILRNYIRQGFNTPEKIINRYAPPSENDTFNYIKYVCSYAGISSSCVLRYGTLDFYLVALAMLRIETNFQTDAKELEQISRMFNIKN